MGEFKERVWVPKDVEERYQDLVKEGAERLGTSVDEIERRARDDSTAFQAAEARAERLGLRSVQELFGYDRDKLSTSAYPGPKCLEPFEVESFIIGDLPVERRDHTKECPTCLSLIESAVPSRERQEEFLHDVGIIAQDLRRSASSAEPAPESRAPSPSMQPRSNRDRRAGPASQVWVDLMLSALPPAAGMAIILATRQDAMRLGSPLLITAAAATAAAFGVTRTRALMQSPLRRSLGAAIGGVAIMAALIPLLLNTRAEPRTLELAQQLAKSAAGEAMLESVVLRHQVDTFPDVIRRGPIEMRRQPSPSARSAVYVGRREELGGEFVAHVDAGAGELIWKSKGHEEPVAQLLVGKITTIDKGQSLSLEGTRGSQTVLAFAKSIPSLATGAEVAVLTDQSGKRALDVVTLSTGKPESSETQ